MSIKLTGRETLAVGKVMLRALADQGIDSHDLTHDEYRAAFVLTAADVKGVAAIPSMTDAQIRAAYGRGWLEGPVQAVRHE